MSATGVVVAIGEMVILSLWFRIGYCFGRLGEERAMERRGQCAHVWDLWQDIARSSAYQQRTCLVCNLTEGRYV